MDVDRAMARYFTEAFFRQLAERLNGDAEWHRRAQGLTMRLLVHITDLREAHMVEVKGGMVATRGVVPEESADLKLQGSYDQWAKFATGENDLPTLVMTGRLRLKGSVTRIMAMQDALTRLVQVAREIGPAR